MKHPVEPGTIRFFSEAQQLAYITYDVPRVMKIKFPQSMLWGRRHSTPRHIVEQGPSLNLDGYFEMLNTVVKSWLARVPAGRQYTCEQDTAPWYTYRKCQKWLSDIFMTSPATTSNFPDCNAIDFKSGLCGARLRNPPTALPVTRRPSWSTRLRRYLRLCLGS